MTVRSYDASVVIEALSLERFEPYLRASARNPEAAVRLYVWNLSVSAALYEALAIVEVVLRNALSAQLADRYSGLEGEWFDDPDGLLCGLAHADIATARRRARKRDNVETPGRVISELSFGFWKYLLAKRYEATLWTRSLRFAFPNLQPQTRAVAYHALDELHTLRNRIAHHEPVHGRDLMADILTIYRVLNWIDTEVRAWAVSLSRLQPIVSSRPS